MANLITVGLRETKVAGALCMDPLKETDLDGLSGGVLNVLNRWVDESILNPFLAKFMASSAGAQQAFKMKAYDAVRTVAEMCAQGTHVGFSLEAASNIAKHLPEDGRMKETIVTFLKAHASDEQ